MEEGKGGVGSGSERSACFGAVGVRGGVWGLSDIVGRAECSMVIIVRVS